MAEHQNLIGLMPLPRKRSFRFIGRHLLEGTTLSAARDPHRCVRQTAGNEGSKERSRTLQGRTACDSDVRLEPLIHGASHESRRRAGTENILLDIGFGAACATAQSWLGMESVRQLRDFFWNLLQDTFGDQIVLNGHPTERLPNTLNVSFIGRAGSEILARIKNVAASTGSACHSGSLELSPVLKARKIPPQIGMGAIRFSLGRTTTREEIQSTVALLTQAVAQSHALA